MENESLFRMANRIGDFFEALPDADEGLEGIASHIRKFWEPRMRRDFLAAVDRGAPGLSEFVQRSVAKHRSLLAS